MKILFVSQYFYPESFRGNDIVFDFFKRGHNITVLTAKPNYPQGKFYKGYGFFSKREEVINGAKIIRTPVIPRGNGGGFGLLINYLSFVFFSFFTVHFRIHEKYDLVFVQQLSPVTMALPGIWVKKKQKIPMILWVLDLWPESVTAASNVRNSWIISFLNKIVRYIYKNSDKILISSNYFKSSIIDKTDDPQKGMIYFPNWAEDVFSNPSVSKNNLPNLPTGFNIMFAGNIGEAQDFEALLSAAEITQNKAPSINWIFVGDGRKSNWIKKEIENRGLTNVFLPGRYPIELMPEFFKKADTMLVSLKDEPIFRLTVPAKVQAYMASGKIILGMMNGEGSEIIQKAQCGYCVPAGDYHQLAEKALLLSVLNQENKEILEKNSLSFYEENFRKENLIDRLENILLNSLVKD